MKNGKISLDSDRGKEIGFTSDNGFDGYLWKEDDYIIISMIQSEGKLLNLFNAIQRKGYGIKVPTPFPRMEKLLRLKGFKHTWEQDKIMGSVEVWVKERKVTFNESNE